MLDFDRSRGDTIIEVLFAITVFSLVVVGSLSIMNQGSSTSQRSLEISLVRNEIDAQAETLRFLNASYVAAYQSGPLDCSSTGETPADRWREIHCMAISAAQLPPFGAINGSCPDIPSDSFIINTKTGEVVKKNTSSFAKATTFAQVRYEPNFIPEGIWIEAVKSDISGNNQDNAGYIDFHIRACWDNPGQSAPLTLGTIVRLYEPLN